MENLSQLKNPHYLIISENIDKLSVKYKEKIDSLRDSIINTDILFVNNVKNNSLVTAQQLHEMFNARNDLSLVEAQFLGVGSSSTNDTINGQLVQSIYETNIAIAEAEIKTLQVDLM